MLLLEDWGISSVSGRKRRSLLGYWSIRYFIILLISIVVVGIATAYLIQLDVKRGQHRGMKLIAGDIAAAVQAGGGHLPKGMELGRWLDDLAYSRGLSDRIVMIIMDGSGSIVQQYPPDLPHEADQLAEKLQKIMTGETHVIELDSYHKKPPYLVAVHPLENNTGYILVMTPKENFLQGFAYLKISRTILGFSIVLIGWGVIYMLTRRLVKPIKEAAVAAKQVVAGNYNLPLDKNHNEQEIYELMHAFKEMADRLSWLESLRTQLLAGVTHELKTPVASISGLVQAVKEEVVTGQEAKMFLEVCLKECRRLHKMVEDLLDFNSFAGNTVTIAKESFDLLAALQEIGSRWQFVQEEAGVGVIVEAAESRSDWRITTDPSRLEQIMINLLNNAKDATEAGGSVYVRLLSDSELYRIQVEDRGQGIPVDEHLDIFEPFYRGKQKKARVRGLGLGLPFSRIIARSMGGELLLAESSPGGTTFTLLLPFEIR